MSFPPPSPILHMTTFSIFLLLLLSIANFSTSSETPPASFGTLVGTFQGVHAYSNQRDETLSWQSSYYDGHYAGVKWQCVEYARRYLMAVRGITFDSVDSAFQIPDAKFSALDGGEGLKINISNVAMEVGSLVIWPKDYQADSPHGHVAVVAAIKLAGIEVAEQNYDDATFLRFVSWSEIKDSNASIITANFAEDKNILASSSCVSESSRCGKFCKRENGRIPASLSYVLYPDGDLIGQILAYLTLSPIYIGCFYLTLIVLRRDMQTMLVLVGQVVGVLLNYVLKRYIKEPRPSDLLPDSHDYGMPSNHSQFIGYFAGIYCMYLVKIAEKHLSTLLKFVYISALLMYSFLVCYSRIYLKYHTISQVFYGYLVGLLLAMIWYTIIRSASDLIRQVFDLPFINRWVVYLRIRDYESVNYASVEESYPLSRRTINRKDA